MRSTSDAKISRVFLPKCSGRPRYFPMPPSFRERKANESRDTSDKKTSTVFWRYQSEMEHERFKVLRVNEQLPRSHYLSSCSLYLTS